MNYFYIGLGDLYLPAVAAALHLGQLDAAVIPSKKDLNALRFFREGEKKDDGDLYFAGVDKSGNNVYVTCVKAQPEVVERAVTSLLGIYNIDPKEIKLRQCLPENPQVVYISKALGLLGAKGTQKMLACRLAYNRYQDLVKISGRAESERQH
jgi:hypothetical protein